MSYKSEILKRFIDGETLASCDFYWSNSNQYFDQIKNDGIVLNEINVKNRKNPNKHLERSLNQDSENVENAKKLLLRYKAKSQRSSSLKMVEPKANEVQVSRNGLN